jgi:hypothetical protein
LNRLLAMLVVYLSFCCVAGSLGAMANGTPYFFPRVTATSRKYISPISTLPSASFCRVRDVLSVKDQAPPPFECREAEQRLKSCPRSTLTFLKTFASPPSRPFSFVHQTAKQAFSVIDHVRSRLSEGCGDVVTKGHDAGIGNLLGKKIFQPKCMRFGCVQVSIESPSSYTTTILEQSRDELDSASWCGPQEAGLMGFTLLDFKMRL